MELIKETLGIFAVVYSIVAIALNLASMAMHKDLIAECLGDCKSIFEKIIFILIHVLMGSFLINFWHKIK
ncbi:Uncharacterised protein [Sphingobacterium multivorum]|uniref:hypothetical protein n=1 Tax=Sphingobacterium multivorum TaxID=28454 RepID=UPI000DFA9877|nr:hypothetical protein [Sphingobacterium multivorum]QQT43367.1 hypothetical protein I6J00_16610 [Sphingobacterium multivorum]SUI98448.1 Uncharacterised protein [Sphingobacterium multivorum]